MNAQTDAKRTLKLCVTVAVMDIFVFIFSTFSSAANHVLALLLLVSHLHERIRFCFFFGFFFSRIQFPLILIARNVYYLKTRSHVRLHRSVAVHENCEPEKWAKKRFGAVPNIAEKYTNM